MSLRSHVCGYLSFVTMWAPVHVWMRVLVHPAVSEFSIEITLKERLCAELWYWMPSCSGLSGCVARTSLRHLATSLRFNPKLAMKWAARSGLAASKLSSKPLSDIYCVPCWFCVIGCLYLKDIWFGLVWFVKTCFKPLDLVVYTWSQLPE